MVYLDCNATTPMESEVREALLPFMTEEYGNEGSRTHSFGARAKQAVQRARELVGKVVGVGRDEVIFTSGATEGNNIALLGLSRWGLKNGRNHIVTTQIEHKAVLEPIERLQKEGFEVDLVAPDEDGWVNPENIKKYLRSNTLVVAMMHANNETGVIQPLPEVIEVLTNHPAYLFVDAAQTYGKIDGGLSHPRVDMLSVSAHKIYGPKGIGALVVRRRGFESIPLEPLMVGGGQERGLRPGTLPVHLIVGFGKAAELAIRDQKKREAACVAFRTKFLKNIEPLKPAFQGDPAKTLKHTANVSFPGVNSEAAMVALKELVAVSNGSACTSASYKPSHVLKAMGFADEQVLRAIRFSWSHLTPEPDWAGIRASLSVLK